MSNPAKPLAVFISYNRSDVGLAREIEQAMVGQGARVWRDQSSIYGGDRWPKILGEAVADTQVMVLLWSAHSATSDFVELEWCTALALKKPILVILLDDTPLPASLASTNGLDVTVWQQQLGPSLKHLAGRSITGNLRKRRSEVFATLESGSEDVHNLTTLMQEKAARLSSPRFLALELLRRILLWVIVASLTALAATAVIWDNPIHLDTRQVFYAALLMVPSMIAVAAAIRVRRHWLKATLLAACAGWLAVLTWYQPRIVAGPVVDVSQPSVVVLFHRSGGADSRQAQLIDVVEALPATLTYLDAEVAVQPFIYSTDPDADYVEKAIRRNPYIRAVVKVAQPSPDVVHIRMEVPALKHWQGLSVQRVYTVSTESRLGQVDTTTMILKPDLGFMLNTSLVGNALDYRAQDFVVSLGMLGSFNNYLESKAGRRSIITGTDRFGDKLSASVAGVYADFLSISMGRNDVDCDALQPLMDISHEAGFEWLEDNRVHCQDDQILAAEYLSGALSDHTRRFIHGVLARRALVGKETNKWGLAVKELDEKSGVVMAENLYAACGSPYLEQSFEVFSSQFRVDHRTVKGAQCLADFIRENEPVFEEPIRSDLAKNLGTAYIMGLQPHPAELVGILGVSMETYCHGLRKRLISLIQDNIFSINFEAAQYLMSLARESGCMESEAAPRFLHLFDFVSQLDFGQLKNSSNVFEQTGKVDPVGQETLRGILAALLGEHERSVYYQVQLDRFMVDYNEAGWCHALERSSDFLSKIGIDDVDVLVSLACETPESIFIQPLAQGTDALAGLPTASTPVLLQQMVLISGMVSDAALLTGEEGLAKGPSATKLLEGLVAYKASAAYLEKYFPEIDPFSALTLNRLNELPPAEQIDYLTQRLASGNSEPLIAYLAEAYLAAGDTTAAASRFRTLVQSGESELRKDYYTTRLVALDASLYCGTVGKHFVTATEIELPQEYTRPLRRVGIVPLADDKLLALLDALDSVETFAVNDKFATFAQGIYGLLDDEFIAKTRETAPGALLRLTIAAWIERDPNHPLWKILQEFNRLNESGDLTEVMAVRERSDVAGCRGG